MKKLSFIVGIIVVSAWVFVLTAGLANTTQGQVVDSHFVLPSLPVDVEEVLSVSNTKNGVCVGYRAEDGSVRMVQYFYTGKEYRVSTFSFGE